MSDTESEESSKHVADGVLARKRYNMKALGQLVDSNRLTGVARPTEVSSGPHHRVDDVPPPDAVDDDAAVDDLDGDDHEVDDEVDAAGADLADLDETDADETDGADDPPHLTALELPDDGSDGHGLDALFDDGDPVEHDATFGPEALLEGTDAASRASSASEADGPGDDGAVAETVIDDGLDDGGQAPDVEQADDQDETLIELRERGARARRRPPAPPHVDGESAAVSDDGVDRTELGTQVTRTGLGGLLEAAPSRARHDPRDSPQPLARHMLDEEIQPGGRLSNPRDVPGIVLNLAKDIPAAAAVSVVRIDEEIELVGNSIDPAIEPGLLASMFSGLFRSIQVAAGALAQGPLGTVHDLVIEGEHMDLILRPLGIHYYLMVLEDRRSENADLAATRMRMAALAPGLSAILAQGDGEA
jgi:predicted regulator of Ras-like GTPase activity (Roadblock/LC7/MglB family)